MGSVGANGRQRRAADIGVIGDQTLGRRAINRPQPKARGRLNGLFVGIFFIGGATGIHAGRTAWAWNGWPSRLLRRRCIRPRSSAGRLDRRPGVRTGPLALLSALAAPNCLVTAHYAGSPLIIRDHPRACHSLGAGLRQQPLH